MIKKLAAIFLNDQGGLSGAQLWLIVPMVLTAAWLIRDLVGGRDFTEVHAAGLGCMLMVGYLNRDGGRKFKKFCLSLGPQGASMEIDGNDNIEN